MPRSAIENVAVDYILPLAEIAPLLAQLAHQPADEEAAPAVSEEMAQEIKVTKMDIDAMTSDDHPGTPSAFSCPECGGVLWELRDGDLIRFRFSLPHRPRLQTGERAGGAVRGAGRGAVGCAQDARGAR